MTRLSLRRSAVVHSVLVVLAVLISATTELGALIKTPLPLKQVLGQSVDVVEARVATVDRDKGRIILEWSADIRGRTRIARLAVVASGAKARKDLARLDKRLRDGLPVVVFVSKGGKATRFLFYSEGTWFSSTYVGGTPPAGRRPREQAKPKDTALTSFSACEVYLRRTYSGTTRELLALLPDVIRGKRKAPKWNGKMKPGLGPELPPVKRREPPRGGGKKREGVGR